MEKEYCEDVDVMLWDALDRAFWAYAAKFAKMKGSDSVTDKMAQEVNAYLAYIKDEEVCYDE